MQMHECTPPCYSTCCTTPNFKSHNILRSRLASRLSVHLGKHVLTDSSIEKYHAAGGMQVVLVNGSHLVWEHGRDRAISVPEGATALHLVCEWGKDDSHLHTEVWGWRSCGQMYQAAWQHTHRNLGSMQATFSVPLEDHTYV